MENRAAGSTPARLLLAYLSRWYALELCLVDFEVVVEFQGSSWQFGILLGHGRMLASATLDSAVGTAQENLRSYNKYKKFPNEAFRELFEDLKSRARY